MRFFSENVHASFVVCQTRPSHLEIVVAASARSICLAHERVEMPIPMGHGPWHRMIDYTSTNPSTELLC